MDEFQKITEKMHQIYLKKNKDYGSSFDKQFDKYGIASVLIRLSDKLNRLEQLTKNGTAEVKDESVEDTLLDLANYAILALLKLQKNKKAGSGDFGFVEDAEDLHKEAEELYDQGEYCPGHVVDDAVEEPIVEDPDAIKKPAHEDAGTVVEGTEEETVEEEAHKDGPTMKMSICYDNGNGLKKVNLNDKEAKEVIEHVEELFNDFFCPPNWLINSINHKFLFD